MYTVSREEPGDRPRPPSYATEADQLTALLRHWAEDEHRTDGGPDKLIFPLEHAYSQASLSFDALKGADAARAAPLRAAAQAADCGLCRALLSIARSGSGSPWSTKGACRPHCRISPICASNGPRAARNSGRPCGFRRTNSPATCWPLGGSGPGGRPNRPVTPVSC